MNFCIVDVLMSLVGVLCMAGCSNSPDWAQRNQRVIDEFKITGRTRELPAVNLPSLLVPGQPVETATLPVAAIAPGVVAKLAWGRGAMLELVEMQAKAVYPEQTLGEELIVIVRDGSAMLEVDGKTIELIKDHVTTSSPARSDR
jgi:hypothetical protein